MFIAQYQSSGSQQQSINSRGYWKYPPRLFPAEPRTHVVSPNILQISPQFGTIYNQSYAAEQVGLDQICGPGYRKSLEFLMKDYAKQKHPTRCDEIERMPLAACIREFASDPRIKGVADRAVWLGNDETHYSRKWVDKDLKDLKLLLDLTVHWISSELLTEQLMTDMAEPKKG